MIMVGKRPVDVFIPDSLRIVLAVLSVLSMALLTSCADTPPSSDTVQTLEARGDTMGTQWSVLWISDDEQQGTVELAQVNQAQVKQALESELLRINGLMSTWDPTSELSLFNSSASVDPVELHKDTLNVIDTALPISRLTAGRYDITLMPIIRLWGFSSRTDSPTPSATEIEAALELSGHQQLVRVDNTVRKRKPLISIDVSSLAKGFAVDQLGDVLESMGITRYLVDIGGELRARGTRADGLVWRVGLESPEGDVPQIIHLHDAHIATSGSYRNYRIEDGKRLSHIIDGATGRPVSHDLVSVSVVHDSTMLADAWATALLVLGEKDAIQMVSDQALVAQLTVHRDGRFEQITSSEFAALLVLE